MNPRDWRMTRIDAAPRFSPVMWQMWQLPLGSTLVLIYEARHCTSDILELVHLVEVASMANIGAWARTERPATRSPEEFAWPETDTKLGFKCRIGEASSRNGGQVHRPWLQIPTSWMAEGHVS